MTIDELWMSLRSILLKLNKKRFLNSTFDIDNWIFLEFLFRSGWLLLNQERRSLKSSRFGRGIQPPNDYLNPGQGMIRGRLIKLGN